MDFSISNAVAVAPSAAVYTSSGSSSAQASVTSTASRELTDTVRLSQSAQIHALIQQGQGAAEIASTMGVPVATVDSILGIVVAAPVVVVATSVDLTVNTKTAGTPAPALIDVRV
jgi:hypothetical protein